MCWSWFEKPILKTEIIEEADGLDEEEKFTNLVIGDNLGGFEGMFLADMYNHDNSATTTFLITYKDGSTAVKEVENGTSLYRKYLKFCK